MNPENPSYPIPQRPPRGQGHVLRSSDELPEVGPITRPDLKRHSLIVAPAELAMTEPARAWLKKFIGSRGRTPSGQTCGTVIHVAVDAETEARRAIAVTRHIVAGGKKDREPLKKVRGLFLPRSPREAEVIRRAYSEAKSALDNFLRNYHLPEEKFVGGIDPVSTEISLASTSPLEAGERITLPGEEYSRLVAGKYDEVVLLCEERRERHFVNRYGRCPWAWVIVFPDLEANSPK